MTNQLPAPLFILASPFSFRSIVSALIGGHPAMYSVPDLNLLSVKTMQEFVDRHFGVSMHGFLRTVAQLYAGEQTMESVQMARRWLLRRISYSTLDVYEEICSKIAPRMLIDRSTTYTDPTLRGAPLLRINETFPGARYLHLLRHPRTQGEAWFRSVAALPMLIEVDSLDYEVDPPVVDPQVDWLRRNSEIVNFLHTIPGQRQMRLRGEEILADPGGQLMQICQWLGLRHNKNIISSMLRPESSSYGRMGPYGSEWGSDFEFQRSPALRTCSRQIVELKGALSWRVDGKGLTEDVIELAVELGYEAPA